MADSSYNEGLALIRSSNGTTNGSPELKPIRSGRRPILKQNGVHPVPHANTNGHANKKAAPNSSRTSAFTQSNRSPLQVDSPRSARDSNFHRPSGRERNLKNPYRYNSENNNHNNTKNTNNSTGRYYYDYNNNNHNRPKPNNQNHNSHPPHRNGFQTSRNGQQNHKYTRDSKIPPTQRPNMFSVSDHQSEPVRRLPEKWKAWPELSIKLSNLPAEATTLDIYNVFERYGSIEKIEIMENNRSGFRDGTGRIVFCPPPTEAVWEKTHKLYKRNDKEMSYVILETKLEEPRGNYMVDSPVTKRKLPEKFQFPCSSIEFGFMFEQLTMMPMFETLASSVMSFEVNLKKRLVIVSFTHEFVDPPGLPEGATKLARIDEFKFEIPFVSLENIYEDPESTLEDRIFIISLQSPPSYWKRIHDIPRTHDDGKYWTDRNTWFRQTDIVYNHKELKTQPVAIKKKKPLIDLGRWTTYRISFKLDEKQRKDFIPMISALKDFNVNVELFENFKRESDHAARIWDVIDRPAEAPVESSFTDELAELERLTAHRTLPFPLRYQLEVCISENRLSEYNLTREFVDRLLEMEEKKKGSAIRLLEFVIEKETRYYNPMDIFSLKPTKDPKSGIPQYCSVMRKATITPTTIYFATPSVETSNRVVRHYQEHADRFLRIQFIDEKGRGKVSANEDNTTNEVYTRAKRTLANGITIGDRHFEFLAFGNSQLREHGAYFFASTDHITAADIRRWMGEFGHIRQVAKHAARLGQCFSTTFSINTVKGTVKEIPDIEHDGHCFSDGCGMISDFVSQMIASELDLISNGVAPSAYQFRLGGAKGVLAVSPQVTGRDVYIRPSQRKFNTQHSGLEIIRAAKLASACLNRQLIVVLKTLEVEDNVFMRKLHSQLNNLKVAMEDPSVALALLRKHIDPNQATLHIAGLILSGFFKSKEPFVMNLLQLWRAWSIKALKEKARIVVEEGAFLIGVVDEVGKLRGHFDITPEEEEKMTGQSKLDNLPEIFLQITDADAPTGFRVVEGTCILARNPSLHPGDMRVVKAVKCPELMHLRNVVVLPQTGTKPLANMCSGGDLDGDDYVVIWDQDFVPNLINHAPMDYTAPKTTPLDRDVKVSDITSFFVNYMKMDKLGTIAHSHLAWADCLEEGVRSAKCIRLAELHSMAVDFPKTGDPAVMEKDLRVHRWPHFMEKFPDNPDKSRQSYKILGKLYDAVQRIAFVPSYELSFDERILNAFVFDSSTIQLAKIIKKEYDEAVRRIMGQHAIKTEFEVYSTLVMSHSGLGKDYKYHEEIGQIRDGLKDRFKKIIINALGRRDEATLGRFAVAMYQITNDEYAMYKNEKDDKQNPPVGVPLISFPWLFHEQLGKVADCSPPFEYRGIPGDEASEPISLATNETIGAYFKEKQSLSLEYEFDTSSQASEPSEGINSYADIGMKVTMPDVESSAWDTLDKENTEGQQPDGGEAMEQTAEGEHSKHGEQIIEQ